MTLKPWNRDFSLCPLAQALGKEVVEISFLEKKLLLHRSPGRKLFCGADLGMTTISFTARVCLRGHAANWQIISKWENIPFPKSKVVPRLSKM